MKSIGIIVTLVLTISTQAQDIPWSVQLAKRAMALWPDSFAVKQGRPAKWSYDEGVVLKALADVWKQTGNGAYFSYIRRQMDLYVKTDGSIRTYNQQDFNIDNINNGRILLFLYRVTGDRRYYRAASLLRDQLVMQPRTPTGGFWHKKIYPNQMWLDGLYMGEPFYAEYTRLFGPDSCWDDIARQFILMEKNARDPKTGLLYHGWDESKLQRWANPATGRSPNFWARAMGWYGMALVDVLDYFPPGQAKRKDLVAILHRFARAICAVQDPSTGLWWDLLNYPGKKGNYPEASASCMFVYTLAKACRKGWLDPSYAEAAKKGYSGILKRFLHHNPDGTADLRGTVSVSGLGGNPYRDGSYGYYISEPVVTNDPKGLGAFIQAAVEMEMMPQLPVGRGKTVLLDNYFNNESRLNAGGQKESFHYTWNDKENSGFSTLGGLFKAHGANLEMLKHGPDSASLARACVYIIVDPDTRKESENPHFIQATDIKAISAWVRRGGVLLLMANDSANVELAHFNKLASVFGIHWSDSGRNFVKGNNFEMGAIPVSPGNPVFPSVHKVYLKEICLIHVQSPARPLVTEGGDVIVAWANYGRGKVLAVGDPWLYNEYTDGRKLPPEYQNFEAARDLVSWSLRNAAVPEAPEKDNRHLKTGLKTRKQE